MIGLDRAALRDTVGVAPTQVLRHFRRDVCDDARIRRDSPTEGVVPMTPDPVSSLVGPEWLEARLEEPDLRVVDCTLHLSFDPKTGLDSPNRGP